MTDFNKVISLFIGLFVVIFLVAFLLGRIKVGNRQTPTSSGALGRVFGLREPSATPTPTTKPADKLVVKQTVESDGEGKTVVVNRTVTIAPQNTQVAPATTPVSEIPRTGPGLLLPLAFSSLAAGAYLRRKS